jgi:bacteriocin-like protein
MFKNPFKKEKKASVSAASSNLKLEKLNKEELNNVSGGSYQALCHNEVIVEEKPTPTH